MWQKRPKKAKKKRAGVKQDRWFDEPESDNQEQNSDQDSAGSAGTDLLEDQDSEPPVTVAIVYERAMRLLVRREHGRKELELKLLQRELPLDLITSALDNLAEEGLQCDIRYAEAYTRARMNRGYGANKIRADLQNRQLDSSIAEDAINSSEADWAELALEALRKKFGRGGLIADFETKAKLQRHLYQRGFEMDEIQTAIKNYDISST